MKCPLVGIADYRRRMALKPASADDRGRGYQASIGASIIDAIWPHVASES